MRAGPHGGRWRGAPEVRIRPKGSAGCLYQIVFLPRLPPAARFLLRERNRGKSAAGAFPCTPGAQGAEAKGTKAQQGRRGWYMCLCAADHTAGSARLLFRVPFGAPAQGFDLSRRRLHPRICQLVPLFRAELPSPVPRREDPMGGTPQGSSLGRRGGFPKGTAFPIIPAKRMLRREEEERPNVRKGLRRLRKPQSRSP